MKSLGETPSAPPSLMGYAAANPDFRAEFGLYLRRYGDLWRQRRTDTFMPIDLGAAEHHVAIQGLIDVQLVDAFLREAAPDAKVRLSDGETLNLYVPLVRVPKRLLLGFTASIGSGTDLPVVPREEDSPFVALELARYCTQHFPETNINEGALWLLLTVLIYLIPSDSASAVLAWLRRRMGRRAARRAVQESRCLDDWLLGEWIREQGDHYARGVGRALEEVFAPVLPFVGRLDDELAFPREDARPGADPLAFFGTIDALLMHAPREIARVVSTNAPPATQATIATLADAFRAPGRQEISDQAAELGAKVWEHLLEGLAALCVVLRADESRTVRRWLADELRAWTPFVAADIELGRPFVLHVEEVLPLTLWNPRTRWRAAPQFIEHQYQIPEDTAPSLHVEVRLENPELRFPAPTSSRWRVRDRNVSLITDIGRGSNPERGPVTALFDGDARTTARHIHFYLARRGEAIETAARRSVLAVPFKLTGEIKRSLWIAVAGLCLAAGFVVSQVFQAVFRHREPEFVSAAITVGALSVTVGLWLVQAQYTSALVARKVRAFRRVAQVPLLVMVLALGALFGSAVVRHGLGASPTPGTTASSSSTRPGTTGLPSTRTTTSGVRKVP
ncbi:MAG TPA: hypothetical protein VF063_07575 [Gaiellaceae bacterium]